MKPEYPKYIQEQIDAALKKTGGDRITNPNANMEFYACSASHEEKKSERFNTPVRVDIYSTRKRKTDIDNISGKAALDGIVNNQLLADDSPDEIAEYQVHKAEIGKIEKTTIVITEL